MREVVPTQSRSGSRIRPSVFIVALVAVFALVAGACGGSSSDSAKGNDEQGSGTTASSQGSIAKLDKLRIYHPETLAFSAPFTIMERDGALSDVAENVSFDSWNTPDVLRSLVTSNGTDITAVPTYVGANLFNKGMDVRMAAVVVWGLLYVIGPDGAAADWESLRGQTIMVPFQNDMPDLVFRYLAEKNGLVPGKDFTIEYYAAPPEVVARLATNKGSWAVLPEHVATAVLNQAETNNIGITRLLNLQDEWAEATGFAPRIPQAGVIVSAQIAERSDVVAALLNELDKAVAEINAAGDATVATLAEASDLPVPVVTSVIPRLNLDVVPGADAREELERFYTELSSFNPDIIGGKLPAADFYLADPR